MTIFTKYSACALALALAAGALPAAATTIWSGPAVSYVQADNAANSCAVVACTEAELQSDVIVQDVVELRRNREANLYNGASETFARRNVSPADTQWVFSGLAGEPTFDLGASFENLASVVAGGLYMQQFVPASGSVPPSIVGVDAIMRIMSEDIYIGFRFTSWQRGGGGGFAYTRTSAPAPIPLPAGGILLLSGVALLTARTRRTARTL